MLTMAKLLAKFMKNDFCACNVIIIKCRTCASVASETVINTRPLMLPESNLHRLLRVAIIGMPNAGKSTLINSLMDRKVCAVSSKVHTTRGQAKAIFTEDDAQIVFVDTPGIVSEKEQKRYSLQKSFVRDSKSVTQQADIIGVVHDVTNIWTRERLDIKIIKLLEMQKRKPSFLVLNKVDALKSKRKLLDLTRQVTENYLDGNPIVGGKPFKRESLENRGWKYFKDIFMVSALTGDGLEELKKYLITNAQPGKWMFPQEVWTDQSAEELIKNTVKATFLNFLPQEIPYQLKPAVEYFNIDEDGIIKCVVIVDCPTERIAKLVAGMSDGKLKQITDSVQKDLQNIFQNYTTIKIVLVPPQK